jgi:mannose-6-phosphate isomerase-like protein (cupin superfamily)
MQKMETRAVIRTADTAPRVPCPCGTSTRIFTRPEMDTASLHVTEMTASTPHYHRLMTEYYYVLEGEGTMILDGQSHPVQPGHTVYIPPGTRHSLQSELGVKAIVFAVPAFMPDDEYFD